MNFLIDKQFEKDVKKLKSPRLNNQLLSLIEQIESADNPTDVPNIKKLSGFTNYYRIRIGNYRLGVILSNDTLLLIRCLHRKDIYKFFP